MQLVWSLRANRDLDHIYDFISRDNPRAAIDMLDTILLAAENLTQHPKIGRRGRVESTHELVIPNTPYVIIYIFARPIIEIAAILHQSRQWPEDFG